MPLAMAKTPSDLAGYLAGLGIETTTIEHAPVFTVEEAQALRGTIPGAHTKNLFLKDKKDRLFLVVAPEDAAIELKHLHGLIGASGRLSFGKPDLLMETLGVTPGSVTALGAINDSPPRVTVVLDGSLARAETVNCHPLVNTATTTLATGDLLKFLRATGHEPVIVDLPRAAIPEL
jgi:Ala-tRNA(Pro) deacylase